MYPVGLVGFFDWVGLWVAGHLPKNIQKWGGAGHWLLAGYKETAPSQGQTPAKSPFTSPAAKI